MERPDRLDTPIPAPPSIHPVARRRQSDRQWPGSGRGLVRVARRFARRLLVVPPGLDTRVPVAEPLVPLGASVVAVLPEHVSGASPGSRPSSLDRSLSSYLGRLVGSPVPDPLAVFGVHAWWSCPGIRIKRIRGIPQFRGGFPQRSVRRPQDRPQETPNWWLSPAPSGRMGGSGNQDGAGEERPESGQTAQGPGGTAKGDAPSSGVDGSCHPGESHQQELHQKGG